MKIYLFAFISLFAVTLISCEKEKGCTDPQALNYNPDAKEDDGSCRTEEDLKEDVRKEISDSLQKTEPIVVEFTLNWSANEKVQIYTDIPDDMENRSILLYIDANGDYVQLPVYTEPWTYWYRFENTQIKVVVENDQGNASSSSFSYDFKAVFIKDQYLKENPRYHKKKVTEMVNN